MAVEHNHEPEVLAAVFAAARVVVMASAAVDAADLSVFEEREISRSERRLALRTDLNALSRLVQMFRFGDDWVDVYGVRGPERVDVANGRFGFKGAKVHCFVTVVLSFQTCGVVLSYALDRSLFSRLS